MAEEAAKPPVYTATLDHEIRSASDKIKRMEDRLVELDEGVAARQLVSNNQETEAKLRRLTSERELAAKGNHRPSEIPMAPLQKLVANLRQLLIDNVPAAHAALAKAVGRA